MEEMKVSVGLDDLVRVLSELRNMDRILSDPNVDSRTRAEIALPIARRIENIIWWLESVVPDYPSDESTDEEEEAISC